jgi:hypothetical protein
MRIDASVTRRAKRSGRIAASGRRAPPLAAASSCSCAGAGDDRRELQRRRAVALVEQLDPVGELALELGRPEDARVLAESQHPRRELAAIRVGRLEDDVAAVARRTDLAEVPEVALDLPGDALGDPDLRRVGGVAELPVGAVGVAAWVEALGAPPEVVLGLRGVRDLAPDAREAEDAQRVALVGVAKEVELSALVEQVVGIDLARARLVAGHRVVVEGDRLVAEDRGLDLRQALGEVVAAGRRGDAQRDRPLLGRPQWVGPAPRDLLQRQPQRLGVGELAVEQRQRRLERGELGVGEGDGGEVEVLRSQRVVLLLGDAVDRALDGQRDSQRLQLRAVGVEAPREGVLVHRAVALDVTADLERRDRPPLGHEIRDEGELADELLRVLGHAGNDTGRWAGSGAASRISQRISEDLRERGRSAGVN